MPSDPQSSLALRRIVPYIPTTISYLLRHRQNFQMNEGQLGKGMQGPYQAYQGLSTMAEG